MSRGLTSPRLDLASRTIDLATTITRGSKLDLVSLVAEASTKAANETIRWLARERISEKAFVYTMQLGRNIAQPNLNGLSVLEKLEQTSSRLYGLDLIMPGALGRTVLYDEHLRWIGTTEAVILKYHSPTYAVEALCDLFASTSLKENDPRIPAVKARIRPVISKAVDSVHLHTVNMGQGAQSLPARIEALPKHYIADLTLTGTIRTLQAMADSDILVQMNCSIIDLLDWIFHHWSGKLVLSVNNEITFDKQLGDSEYSLTVLIENECTADTDCHDGEHVQSFKIGKSVGSSFTMAGQIYEGITDPGIGCQNESHYRSSLYDIRNPFQTRNLALTRTEQKTAERYAQELVRSIIELPVCPMETDLGFRVDRKSKVKYRWWLKKTPTLLQKNLGSTAPARLLFSKRHSPPKNDEEDEDDTSYTTDQIAQWYPEIYSSLELAYSRCECGCNGIALSEALEQEPEPGCLINMMYTEVLLQIAHAMAEAAGAYDVSNPQGTSSAENLSEATVALLGSIALYGKIYWDTWFRLASSAVTGLPYDMANGETFDVGGGILFWVAGSMTVAPAWFALDSEIKLESSWGIRQLTGSVLGLEAETAVIESQRSSTATATDIPSPVSVSSGEDGDDVQLESIIFSNTGELYRIATMVRTQSALRIVNPTSVYRGAILAGRPICAHEKFEDVTVHAWSLNDIILGWNDWMGWNDRKTPNEDYPHVALLGNSPTKQNIALGFAAGRCILQGSHCCFRCLAETAKVERLYGIFGGTSSHTKRLRYR